MRTALVLVVALTAMTACGAPPPEPLPAGVDVERLATDPSRYPAAPRREVKQLADGLHGVVKVTVEHTLVDGGGTSASFVAQGTGSLVVVGGTWMVLTARHLVVPDAGTHRVVDVITGDETVLDGVTSTSARVRLGSLGVEPSAARIARHADAAALEIGIDDRRALWEGVFVDAASPIDLGGGPVGAGQEVEAWGFPAQHLPQVVKPSIAAVQPSYLAVNQGLERGWSGGPLLVARAGHKRLVGVVVRTDDTSGQSLAIGYDQIDPVLRNRAGQVVRVERGGTVTLGGTQLTLEAR